MTISKRWIVASAAAALLGIPGVGSAQGDQEFLGRALGMNQLEIDLGHLARRNGGEDVKAMGNKMIKNHTDFGMQLSTLAQQSGAPVRAEAPPERQQVFAKLEPLSGEAFDAAFKETVDAIHVKELSMYEDEVPRASDPQLHALAERRVATLRKTVAGAQQAKQQKGW
jgi:putative membrane protein